MTHRKSTQCCCQQGLLQDCTLWQSVCNGSTDPNNMPASCQFNASGQFNQVYVQCCDVGGPEFPITEYIGTMSMTATGTRVIFNPPFGNPCHDGFTGVGVSLWQAGQGVRYTLQGTWTAQLIVRQYLLNTDPVTGECLGSILCYEDTYSAAGSVSGCATCGFCPFPVNTAQPCNCGFGGGTNCIYYRGWAVGLAGTGNLLGSRQYFGACCADRQKQGLDCYEQFAPDTCNAQAQMQFRAGCGSPNTGCQTLTQGGCTDPNQSSGEMGCCVIGQIPLAFNRNTYSQCYASENVGGTASLNF